VPQIIVAAAFNWLSPVALQRDRHFRLAAFVDDKQRAAFGSPSKAGLAVDREPNSGSWVIEVYQSKDLRFSTRCTLTLGRKILEWEESKHLPTMGTLLRIEPVVRHATVIGQADRREAPRSLQSATDRRIVPSSRSPNLERSPIHLSEGRSREVQTGSMPLLVRVEIAEGGVLKPG
jgi:hypothetical protein